MPRPPRQIAGGMIYHVLNRGNGRRMLFTKDDDFIAFGAILGEGLQQHPVDLLAYCLMGNHWHLLLRPRSGRALSRLMAWVTVTHARRHHMHYRQPGSGHLYQGRFKSFPVQSDEHFLTVARYAHANPRRAGLVARAQDWAWSDAGGGGKLKLPLHDWPVDRPNHWQRLINEPMAEQEVEAVRRSVTRGAPFGSPQWTSKTAAALNLKSTLRPRGRPNRPLESLSHKYRRHRQRKERAMVDKSR